MSMWTEWATGEVSRANGRIIAEFDCGSDALLFCRAKSAREGKPYEVTPGIERIYAVRQVFTVIHQPRSQQEPCEKV